MPTKIGAFEAKTRFSEILQEVNQGAAFTVTLRGKPIAYLGPIPEENQRKKVAAEAVEQLLNTPRIQGVSAEMIKEWIDEGRKY